MRQALRLHPDSLCAASARIEVEVARPRAGSLVLSYVVTGKIGDLRLPPVTASARADELWQHTCFEAFLRPSPGEAYYEFNFAPSTQWAAYRFDGYRSGMRVAGEIAAPRIEVQSGAERYALQAALELDALPNLPRDGRLAPRPRSGDRGNERQQIILGIGASAGQAGFPSCRWLCA